MCQVLTPKLNATVAERVHSLSLEIRHQSWNRMWLRRGSNLIACFFASVVFLLVQVSNQDVGTSSPALLPAAHPDRLHSVITIHVFPTSSLGVLTPRLQQST